MFKSGNILKVWWKCYKYLAVNLVSSEKNENISTKLPSAMQCLLFWTTMYMQLLYLNIICNTSNKFEISVGLYGNVPLN